MRLALLADRGVQAEKVPEVRRQGLPVAELISVERRGFTRDYFATVLPEPDMRLPAPGIFLPFFKNCFRREEALQRAPV